MSWKVSVVALPLIAGSMAACGPGTTEGPVRGGVFDTVTSTIASCGNGRLEATEQCDDANFANLDGCDMSCRFEQVHRFNALEVMFGTDPFCGANAIGGAIGSVAQSTLQSNVASAVNGGSISTLLQFIGLSDMTGGDQNVAIGCVTGQPVPGQSYDGSNDLDWWYHASAADVSSDGTPLALVDASIHDRELSIAGGRILLSLDVGGGSAPVALSSVRARATIGGSRRPKVHGSRPVGHREFENVDPALVSFASTGSGELCGNISALSLARLPVPSSLRQGGSSACSQGYTTDNSMLDVLIGGCSVWFFTAITATQPDQFDPGVPQVGAGAPYQLEAGDDRGIHHCYDRNGVRVRLRDCLAAAAYSSAVGFTTDRVMITGVE
jgi:cysteine-rich repeat protein